MSDRINDFLDKICASVKYRTMHSEIREEFKNHIDGRKKYNNPRSS